MDFSLRNSFNKHIKRISTGGPVDINHEEQPILLDHDDHSMRSVESEDRREVIVKIDGGDQANSMATRDAPPTGGVGVGGGSKIWRESSYDFWKEGDRDNAGTISGGGGEVFNFRPQGNEDPPSKLIGQFLNKQKASGEMALDMDLEMDELWHDRNSLPPVAESPSANRTSREQKVSFQHPSPNVVEIAPDPTPMGCGEDTSSDEEGYKQQQQPHLHKPSNYFTAAAAVEDGGGEILRCTSNASFQKKSTLLRLKTKSRLLDPPQQPDRRSGLIPKSGQLKSGFLGRPTDEEDDDPFLDEDLPDEYKKTNFSALTFLQWVSLVLIIGALICSLTIPILKDKKLWQLELWKWEMLVLVLICGRLVSGWGIRIVVFFIERNFLLRKRVLYFVYGVRRAVQNCLWLGLVLIAWHFLFDKKVERQTDNSKVLEIVTKILVCLLVATLLWLVKTLMVKVLASSFHVSTYFDRIQDSLFNQYVIETLSGPPLIEMQNTQDEEDRIYAEVQKLQNAGATVPPDLRASAFPPTKSGRVIGSGGLKTPIGKSIKFSGSISKKQDEGITIDHLHKLNHKNVSAWNMKRLMNIVRHGVLSTLDEQIVDSSRDDESATQIRSELEAKAAAKKIFYNVAKHRSRYIYLEDLMRFMREDEALKTLALFEGTTETRRINKASLKNWVVNAFRERRALALTLNDTKTAVNKLHRMVNIVVFIIIVVISLLILGIATSQYLIFLSSQLVVAAFIFGNTLKTIFEAIIFLFVMHPFDVGDRCEIEGVQMVVEEMNILNTIFLRYDNQKIFFPNAVLATKYIGNYYRSPDMGDAVEFCVHISTPAEKIAIMRQRITCYIENKKEHWYPAPMIILKDVEEFNRLRFAVWLQHRINHQDMGEKWSRRAILVEEMVKIFRELDIQYRLWPIDINVTSLPTPTPTSTRVPPGWTTTTS